MAKDQVKIEIQGIPPEWLSYKIEGNHNDVVEALHSVMKVHQGLFTILEEACNKYKQESNG